jgi:hypothetical protein
MAGPWDLRGPAEAAQQLPSPLGMDRATEDLGHPRRHSGAGPAAAIGRGMVQGLGQLSPLGCRQQSCSSRVVMTSVPKPCGTMLVVALGERADPVGRVAGDGGHPFRGQALGQQPDDLPMAARHRLFGGAIAMLQCVKREVWLNGKSFWHVRIIHPDLVSERLSASG